MEYYNSDSIEQYEKRNNTLKLVMILVIALLCVWMIMFMLVIFVLPNTGTSKDTITKVNTSAPILNILSCPEQLSSENPSGIVEGVIVSGNSSCVLYINSEEVARSTKAGQQVKWSKQISLSAGENTSLNFELKDENGNSANENRTVYCARSTGELNTVSTSNYRVYGYFVKGVDDAIYIRSGAGKNHTPVQLVKDYSAIAYLGDYKYGSDGYVWYHVIAPNGCYGYVRSDVVWML